mgnify:CR=1 FL=1
MVYDPKRRGLLDPTGGLIDADVERGLLDVGPRSQANLFNKGIDPKIWHSEYLHGKQAHPGVVDKYKALRAYGKTILVRLDLTAGERKGKTDALARASQGIAVDRKPALTNVHYYDPKTDTLGKDRIMVGRGQALQGNIGFRVDQTARGATVKSGKKTANAGIWGQASRLNEDQVKYLKKHGVEIRYNPKTQNAFTDTKNRVARPFNGYAWQEGTRAWVLDNNWSKKGIKFYPSLSSMPEDLRKSVKPGDIEYRFRGGSGGAFTKSPTARIGGGPRRHKTIQEMLADIVN